MTRGGVRKAARAASVAAALVAGALTGGAGPASAQAPPPADTTPVAFRLGDPSPNPFQEEVRIPFRLGPEEASGADPRGEDRERGAASDSAVVSLAVYNVLYQRVAWARIREEDGEEGAPVRDRSFAVPGRYEVVWPGRAREGRQVPAGPYFLELVVDGRTAVRKVILTR